MGEGLTPREQGLRVGHEYAMAFANDRAKLRRASVRAKDADEVKASIDWSFLEPTSQQRPVAFWSGFAHGVRDFLVDEAAALSGHAPRVGTQRASGNYPTGDTGSG